MAHSAGIIEVNPIEWVGDACNIPTRVTERSVPVSHDDTASAVPPQYSHRIKLHPRISIPRSVKAKVWYFTWGRCWYCGGHLNPFEDLCIDHVFPLSRGGTNDIENLVPCCNHCNIEKGTSTVDEWRVNFRHAAVLDEEPWIHPTGLFFFERDNGFFQSMREDEIRYYYRALERDQG